MHCQTTITIARADAYLIDRCDCALIGTTEDGRVRYSYERLIEHFHIHDRASDLDPPDDEELVATEWVEFNVIKGLEHIPPTQRPEIVSEETEL